MQSTHRIKRTRSSEDDDDEDDDEAEISDNGMPDFGRGRPSEILTTLLSEFSSLLSSKPVMLNHGHLLQVFVVCTQALKIPVVDPLALTNGVIMISFSLQKYLNVMVSLLQFPEYPIRAQAASLCLQLLQEVPQPPTSLPPRV